MHTDVKYNRRLFFRKVLAGSSVLAVGMYAACKPRNPLGHIKGGIVGANSATGHLMRNIASLPKPSRTTNANILIIGGGISGLSAKRWLHKQGIGNVMLIEMDEHFGGNAHWGRNPVSAYPWGAHYLPVPDTRNTELLEFLSESNVITGFAPDGLPIYNEYHLCMDPEERLFINGLWQEGIVPEAGVPHAEKDQIKRFFSMVNNFKKAIGADGKDAFTIPLDNSSADETFRKLDAITFRQYLTAEGFTSNYLLWYLDYGCKDDYGSNLDTTSAWAGLHYFASRKGKGSNTNSAGVLTWPEGNGFLMEHLRKQVEQTGIFSAQLAYVVEFTKGGVSVKVYDAAKKESYIIEAEKLLIASPQFVNKHLLAGVAPADKINAWTGFHYAPWVIANITLAQMPLQRGFPLCWDNVIYGTPSVGYVDANHQDLVNSRKRVFTYYLPLVSEEPDVARHRAQATTYAHWLEIITEEMERAHPGFTECIETVDIWIWGHGMIAPRPGFIWGEGRRGAIAPIDNKIFFAHTDLSGISIFEEAFYQGIRAAKEIVQTT